MDNIVNRIDSFFLKQDKVYFQPEEGERNPSGTTVQRGPKGGYYYQHKKESFIDSKQLTKESIRNLDKQLSQWMKFSKEFLKLRKETRGKFKERFKETNETMGEIISDAENIMVRDKYYIQQEAQVFFVHNERILDGGISFDEKGIHWLATSPRNIIGKEIKGVGSFLMYKVFKYILEKYPKIKIYDVACPAEDSIKFYKKVGFDPQKYWSIKSEDMKKFVDLYEKKHG